MTLLDSFEIPLIQATNENLKGYGYLVDDYDQTEIEITTWPKKGWRDIEKGTGNEGGITEGPFETWWQGDILYGRNNAVEHKSDYEKDGQYLLGYSCHPKKASENSLKSDQNKYLFGMSTIILMEVSYFFLIIMSPLSHLWPYPVMICI